MDKVESSLSRFADGFNCSQAVLSVYAEQLGLDDEVALKITAGFGGGMGRMADTCGAVTGAFMVLGLLHGTTTVDRESKERVYGLITDFARRFKARHGAIVCRDLLGCDISDPDGLRRAIVEKMFSTMCPKFVRDAVEILEEMAERIDQSKSN